jgi:hypothetical protein
MKAPVKRVKNKTSKSIDKNNSQYNEVIVSIPDLFNPEPFLANYVLTDH